ncbi:MAG TPA: alpha/beta hydrolase, partial [Gemmatales bacterium]|nr:alpha/beta hydrolase [Gemmatales bacterium]
MRTHMILGCLLLACCLAHAGEGRLQHDGVELFYQDTGNPQGEPVVLVHGFAVNSGLQWGLPGISKALTESQYRVILFDNRGHGRSTRPHEADKYGMPMVHDIRRLLDHLDVKKAHVVGYSMGAFLTHKFAATYPDRVKSITLGGAGWLREGPATEVMDEMSQSLRTSRSLAPL